MSDNTSNNEQKWKKNSTHTSANTSSPIHSVSGKVVLLSVIMTLYTVCFLKSVNERRSILWNTTSTNKDTTIGIAESEKLNCFLIPRKINAKCVKCNGFSLAQQFFFFCLFLGWMADILAHKRSGEAHVAVPVMYNFSFPSIGRNRSEIFESANRNANDTRPVRWALAFCSKVSYILRMRGMKSKK